MGLPRQGVGNWCSGARDVAPALGTGMAFRLEVLSCRGLPPEEPLGLSLDRVGCTLGRNPDNDLVLVDPERLVSGRHAQI